MQRSKGLALMFLLGALLVGGALGFTADRVLARDECPRSGHRGDMRRRFAEAIGLTPAQQASVDSIMERRRREMDGLFAPLHPQMHAIRDSSREQIRRILDDQQRARFERHLSEQERNGKGRVILRVKE